MNLAFVVGCSQYEDPEIASLQYADADAALFASLVKEQCGLDSEAVFLLTSVNADPRHRATRSNIIRHISIAKARSNERQVDKLFFFFSGHGFHSTAHGSDFLIPADAAGSSLEETCLALDALLNYLSAWKASATFMFLDVCRAVVSAGKSASDLQPIDVLSLSFRGTAVFWSCSPEQKSFEARQLGNGVFTYAVAQGLGDTGKCKTVYELDQYLASSVPSISAANQLPIQRPFSRIEPIALKDVILISQSRYRELQSTLTPGQELRTRMAPIGREFPNILVCGIDFGTSYSAVSMMDSQKNIVWVPAGDGRVLMPSVVSIYPNLDYVTGWYAIERGRLQPESTFYNIKRALGSGQLFSVYGKTLTPEFLVSLILRSLKTRAEEFVGRSFDLAIVSAPANFTLQQCGALLEACKMAGLPLFRLIGEPSAAALVAYHDLIPRLKSMGDAIVYILDLGGGTFDVSILEVGGDGLYEIKASGGDRNLGGADFDEHVFRYIRSRAQELLRASTYEFSALDLSQMKREAERVKIALGAREETVAILDGLELPGKGIRNLEVPISRGLFRSLTEDLNRRIEACILDSLKRSDIKKRLISMVISAGQGAKIFTVGELLDRLFAGIPREASYQENAVALGLGRYTGVIAGMKLDTLLVDALPTEIGLMCSKRLSEKEMTSLTSFFISRNDSENTKVLILIPRDATIPTLKSQIGQVAPSQQGPVTLTIVEVDLDGSVMPIGHSELNLRDEPFEIRCDIDANRTIQLEISQGSKLLETFQLNNFFITHHPHHPLEDSNNVPRKLLTAPFK